jgi:hypothetical protein
VTSPVKKAYKHRELAARGFQVFPSSNTTFLVTTTQGNQHIVSLPPITPDRLQGSCSCRKYDDFNAPYVHAITCILYLGRDPFHYFSKRYKWDISLRIYKEPIQPIIIQGLQVLAGDSIRPPVKKAKRGRLKVARIQANYGVKKHTHNCSVCLQSRHNRRICPNQPIEHGRAQRALDRLVVKGKYSLFLYKYHIYLQ